MSKPNITPSPKAPEPVAIRASGYEAVSDRIDELAHELNQPLTAIQMYAEAACAHMAKGAADQDLLLSLFEKIAAQSARGNSISGELRSILRQSRAASDLNNNE